MKLGCYGILPANVRYDRSLSAGAKLLYAELSAACDYTGEVHDLDMRFLASVLDCDRRSVYRYLSALTDAGYVQKVDSDNIKLPMGFDPLVAKTAPEIPEQDIKFFDSFLSSFERGVGTVIDKKDAYYKVLAKRLSYFSPSEMMRALENRISFVVGSEWHQKEQNRPNATDIQLLIKDDETMLKWLNMKQDKSEVELKAIKFE